MVIFWYFINILVDITVFENELYFLFKNNYIKLVLHYENFLTFSILFS